MITGSKTIAEYAIRKWLQGENFVMSQFHAHNERKRRTFKR